MTESRAAMPLGKLAPNRERMATAVDAGRFLSLPPRPIVEPAPLASWPMDKNDVAGDCVVAALDHALQAQAVQLGVQRTNWTDAQILAHYQTQNPGFRSWSDAGGPNDGGMVIQDFLDHLVHTGDILAFGLVDHKSEDAMKAGIYVGLALVTGEVLEVAQQTQDTWDYSPSGEWGGHCTTSVAFDPDHQGLITWGELVEATDSFVSHQMDEVWFVLTPALMNHPEFRDNFDAEGFARAVSDVTGGKVVVPVDPPAPPPEPPMPDDPMADYPLIAVDAWLNRASHLFHTRVERIAAAQLRAWEQRHNI